MSVGWDQTFAFDRSALSSAHRAVVREPGLSVVERREQLPYGKNKVDGYLAYLDRLGLYDRPSGGATPLGAVVAEGDPGWQDEGTWAVLQMQIACAPEATVWYEMTHGVLPHAAAFTLVEAERALLSRPDVQAGSLENAVGDLGRYVRALTEAEALGGLRLLAKVALPGGDRYVRQPPAYLPPLVLAYGLYAHRARTAPDARSVGYDALAAPGGVLRALHLHADPEALADHVRPLKAGDVLDFTQTAGLRDVGFLRPDADPLDWLRAYYADA